MHAAQAFFGEAAILLPPAAAAASTALRLSSLAGSSRRLANAQARFESTYVPPKGRDLPPLNFGPGLLRASSAVRKHLLDEHGVSIREVVLNSNFDPDATQNGKKGRVNLECTIRLKDNKDIPKSNQLYEAAMRFLTPNQREYTRQYQEFLRKAEAARARAFRLKARRAGEVISESARLAGKADNVVPGIRRDVGVSLVPTALALGFVGARRAGRSLAAFFRGKHRKGGAGKPSVTQGARVTSRATPPQDVARRPRKPLLLTAQRPAHSRLWLDPDLRKALEPDGIEADFVKAIIFHGIKHPLSVMEEIPPQDASTIERAVLQKIGGGQKAPEVRRVLDWLVDKGVFLERGKTLKLDLFPQTREGAMVVDAFLKLAAKRISDASERRKRS